MAKCIPTLLAGDKFGLLTAVKDAGRNPKIERLWEFRCDCGTLKILRASSVIRGNTQSCGCLYRLRGEKRRTHGLSESSEYTIWLSMKRRCFVEKCKAYPNYGGRGITVCERWLKFENFLADMGRRPSPKHTLERIDNDGPYCKENCCWDTRTAQARNKRGNRIIEHGGERLCVREWEDRLGLKPNTIGGRLHEGWDEIRAITTPRTENRTGTPQLITYAGETLSLRGWSKRTRLSRACIKERLDKGWSVENALTTPSVKTPSSGSI